MRDRVKNLMDALRARMSQRGAAQVAATGRVVVPLTPVEVARAGVTLLFSRSWLCAFCGAQMRIRAREDRQGGPSNFTAYPPNYPIEKLRGHATLGSEFLTWNGLAEERGWQTTPKVKCPACVRGMTREEYKRSRRA